MSFKSLLRGKDKAERDERVIEACEQLMSEIGAEMHDNLVQRLSTFRVKFERYLSSNTGQSGNLEATELLAEIESIAQLIRNTSRRLVPVVSEGASIESMLREACKTLGSSIGGIINVTVDGEQPVVSLETEIHIVRIVQELVYNALRHSLAWHVNVHVTFKSRRVNIEVEDDGTSINSMDKVIERLTGKRSTIRIRSEMLRGHVKYRKGEKGLIVMVELNPD